MGDEEKECGGRIRKTVDDRLDGVRGVAVGCDKARQGWPTTSKGE